MFDALEIVWTYSREKHPGHIRLGCFFICV
nr:MAG TPA: hypothetical protein [Caudoviricetes sp.]